jgi:acyl-CoA thioester hydrolase
MTDEPNLTEFHARAADTIRFGDTDRNGHVNNAVFATFLETGRVQLLFDATIRSLQPGASFVLARLTVDFRAELQWPGTVEIGTRVHSIGRSSIRFEQALFQNGRCVAKAESVIVLIDGGTRKSTPICDEVKHHFQRRAARDLSP